jgi:hypothetical protein
LFNFEAYTAPATSERHAAVTMNFFIADLQGQNFFCCRFASQPILG